MSLLQMRHRAGISCELASQLNHIYLPPSIAPNCSASPFFGQDSGPGEHFAAAQFI
jgi:hypothetical protein